MAGRARLSGVSLRFASAAFSLALLLTQLFRNMLARYHFWLCANSSLLAALVCLTGRFGSLLSRASLARLSGKSLSGGRHPSRI